MPKELEVGTRFRKDKIVLEVTTTNNNLTVERYEIDGPQKRISVLPLKRIGPTEIRILRGGNSKWTNVTPNHDDSI